MLFRVFCSDPGDPCIANFQCLSHDCKKNTCAGFTTAKLFSMILLCIAISSACLVLSIFSIYKYRIFRNRRRAAARDVGWDLREYFMPPADPNFGLVVGHGETAL